MSSDWIHQNFPNWWVGWKSLVDRTTGQNISDWTQFVAVDMLYTRKDQLSKDIAEQMTGLALEISDIKIDGA